MNFVLLGWLRPVRARNADNMVRLRPSLPTARSESRISDRATTQFTQRRDDRVGPSHLPECVVAQIKPTAVEPRPRDVVAGQPSRKAVGLEGSPLIHAIVACRYRR